MNSLPSAQFRTNYAGLTEPTEVHAGRRLLGTWYPAGTEPTRAPKATTPSPEPTDAPKPATKTLSTSARAQHERDQWLNRLNG